MGARKFLMLVIALLSAACVAPTETRQPPGLRMDDRRPVDEMIDGYVESGAYPFLYVRLEDEGGRVVYEHASINDALLPGWIIDGGQWIRIWSMSKIVTITIALDLVEEGMLKLDDPVSWYIPEFSGLKVAVSPTGGSLAAETDPAVGCPYQEVPLRRPMTIRHLINHEAGFFYADMALDCLGGALAEQNITRAADSQALINSLASIPLVMQPGETRHYGLNTTVLGLVMERAAGKTLQQLVEERITAPMDIDGLRYGLPEGATMLPRFSGKEGFLREARPGELNIMGPDVPDTDPAHPLYLGGEGMVATADGYADFLRMLLRRGRLNGHRFLEESTIAEMTAPQTQLDNDYGYDGYNLWVNNGRQADGSWGVGGLWIGGGYEGTHFWVDPERRFVGVIMTQVFWIPESAYHRDEKIRSAIYAQLRGD